MLHTRSHMLFARVRARRCVPTYLKSLSRAQHLYAWKRSTRLYRRYTLSKSALRYALRGYDEYILCDYQFYYVLLLFVGSIMFTAQSDMLDSRFWLTQHAREFGWGRLFRRRRRIRRRHSAKRRPRRLFRYERKFNVTQRI
jgi:hypothetical protein